MSIPKILFAVLCISIAACKKPKPEPPIVPDPVDTTSITTYDTSSALKVGNYWVYQIYDVYLANDSAVAQNIFDSSYVESEILIGHTTYYKYCSKRTGSPSLSIYYLRDSLHYIVNSGGEIMFSSEDFTTVFLDRPFGPNGATADTMNVRRQMTNRNTVITVPAGTFTASAFSTIYYYPPGSPKSDKYLHDWYAKNIGKVKFPWAFYLAQSEQYSEYRLVRYHVQ